jgi:hypothetical protein
MGVVSKAELSWNESVHMRGRSLGRFFGWALVAAPFFFGPRAGAVESFQKKPAGRVTFSRDVRPFLSDKCFACHGFDARKRKGGLRLDTREGTFGRGESGSPAVVPGNPALSELWKRVNSTDRDEVMPPSKAHKSLDAAEKELLRIWIEQGAEYQGHWAFDRPVKPQVPPGAVNPVDAFLLDRLKAEGLGFSEMASREAWIRRVTLALTGLPPTLSEVEDFARDASPGAEGRVVDRLLALPQYGEQMARHWLDLARYGDTHGLHLDNERSIWPYRDWVIGAFNQNLPFDQFTVEQIAGDLLPAPTLEQLVATGFNRCNVTTNEGGSIAEEFQFRYAVDRTSTLAQTWLGMTAGCAVCHDHKFDPLTQQEFYQLYAFYNSSADSALDGNALLPAPKVRLATPQQKAQIAALDLKIQEAEDALQAGVRQLDYQDPASITPAVLAKEEAVVVLDDDFPVGAEVRSTPEGRNPVWVTKENGPVCLGSRSLKIAGQSLVQHYYRTGAAPFEVPPCGRISLMVFLDPVEPPSAVMVQVHTDGWKHRAVWGELEALPYGTPETQERMLAGTLPSSGNWAQLEVDAAKIGLKAGDQILGFALTHSGGTAYFDQLSLVGRVDAANDPKKSFELWSKSQRAKDLQNAPDTIVRLLKVPANYRSAAEKQELRDYYLANVCTETRAKLGPLREAVQALRRERESLDAAIPASLVMGSLKPGRQSHVMDRGAYDRPGEKVAPGVPGFLPPLAPADPANPTRLDLARWLVNGENPLTARVMVNRVWQQFFGVGLVKTAGDFGSQGEPPSHPALLDWLAVHFQESGWDVKALVRLLVTSEAYRQGSAAPLELWQRDPENRLLGRGVRFRLAAEEIRDQALAVSGLLVDTMGGKGVRPYQPANIWEPVGFVGSNTRFYKQDSGPGLYRRSIYTFLKRTAPPPFMVNFDAPSREESCVRRERSDTPLQALQLLNDVQFVEAGRALGVRMLVEGGTTDDQRIEHGFRLVLARYPEPGEVAVVKAALKQHRVSFQERAEAAQALVRVGQTPLKPGLVESEVAAWTLVGNLLLNLDETLNLP